MTERHTDERLLNLEFPVRFEDVLRRGRGPRCEQIFVSSAQGKNVRGSLEGGVVHEYDPAMNG